MEKKDSKGLKILGFFLILCLTGFMGYTAIVGFGPNKIGSAYNVKQGLDLAGGVSITYQIVGEEAPTQEDINDTLYKLKMKAESYSTEAQVYQEGTDRITIEIPGVSDADAILKDLGKPGSLYFIAQTDADGNQNYTYKTTLDGQLVYYDENGNEFYYIPIIRPYFSITKPSVQNLTKTETQFPILSDRLKISIFSTCS